MAYAAWTASTAYAVGDVVRATSVQASGLVFRCTDAGTSDSTQPAWPTDIGSTIVDNTVTWTAISSVYEELSVLAPNAVIELFQLTLDATLHGTSDTYYFHAGTNANVTGNIVWNGNQYTRLPIQAEGFDYSNGGTLPRPTLSVANLGGEISALLLLANAVTPGNDLGGAKVTRIRTLKKFLDGEATADVHAKFPDEIWYVDRKSAENRDVVQWELASKLDLAGMMIPKRQIVANICQWQYRSSECGYVGTGYYNAQDQVVGTLAEDVCGKRLDSCKLRFAPITRTGSVTDGNNQLTLTSAISIETGAQISGHGVPTSTTVSAVSGDGRTVTMSNNANASTTATLTGTIQPNGTSLVVSSSSALATGMRVSGSQIRSGTTITAIAGTTLTLSQAATVTYTLQATRTGQVLRVTLPRYGRAGSFQLVFPSGTTGISVGQIVRGPGLPNNYSTTVTRIYNIYTLLGPKVIVETSYTFTSESASGSYTFYSVDAYSSASYTFTGNNRYVFRDPAYTLPFGSFPGAGLTT